jgi:acetyl-CoA carboxylase carboxyl transferase subunit alpha
LGVIDAVIAEPLGAAHRDPHTAAHSLEQYISKTLRDLKRCKIENLLERRYARFREQGVILEKRAGAKAASRRAGFTRRFWITSQMMPCRCITSV